MNINELKDAARRFLSASQNNQWQQGPYAQWPQQGPGQGQGYNAYGPGQGQGQPWQGNPQQARGTIPPNPYYNPPQGQYPPPRNYQGPYPPQGYQQPYPPQQQGGGFWDGIGGSIVGGLAGGIAGEMIGDALFGNNGGYDGPREEIVNNYYDQSPQPDFNQGQQDMSGGWDNGGDVGGWDNGGDAGGWDNGDSGGFDGGNDGGGW